MKRSAGVQIIIAFLVSALARPAVGVAATPSNVLTRVALSATGPRVAVFVVPLDLSASQQQGALEGAAEAALVRAERFTVVPVQDAFNPASASKHAQSVDDARAKLKSGKAALDELDNVKATADFKDALDALQKSDLTREFPALLDAWTMKAAGHAIGGENAPAKKDIEAVVALSPRAEFSPAFFPPDLIKFAEGQKKLAGNAKGELLVRTEPPGARVWVDGQFRGVSPVTIAGLTSAKHFVTASLGGYALAQSQVSPGEAQLDLELSELAQPWKKALLDTKRDPEGEVRDTSAQAVAKAAAVDQVLLVIAKKSTAGEQLELIGVRLEASDGHNDAYRVGTVNVGDPEALNGFFDGLAAKDDKRDGKSAVHHYTGAEGADLRTIATYSALGGGALFIITGIVLGTMALIQHDAFLATPQPLTGPSAKFFGEGRALSIGADISYGIGLAGLAAGAVLFFTKPSSGSSSPEPVKADDSKKRDAEKQRQQDDEKAAAVAREKEDSKKREDEARAAEEKKKKDDEAAAAAAKKDEDEKKKLSKKEQAALEKKEREEAERQRKEDEKRAAEEEKKRKDEEKRQAAEDEKKRKEDEKRAAEEEKKRKDDEKKAAKGASKKEKEEAERKAKEEEEARLKAEEETKAKEAAEKKKRDEEEKKRREAEEKKKKEEDHDDLRNY